MKDRWIGAIGLVFALIFVLSIVYVIRQQIATDCHSQCKYGDSACKKHCIERHYCQQSRRINEQVPAPSSRNNTHTLIEIIGLSN